VFMSIYLVVLPDDSLLDAAIHEIEKECACGLRLLVLCCLVL